MKILTDLKNLEKALWIKAFKKEVSQEEQGSAPIFRRKFFLSGKVIKASLVITALGIFEGRLNGNAISADKLAPGWTDYNKRVQYCSYDVSELICCGLNVLEVVLGYGWYAGTVGINPPGKIYKSCVPKLKYVLRVETENQIQVFFSDGSEEVCSEGGILYNDLYMGEIQDGRRGVWADKNFNNWKNVFTVRDKRRYLCPMIEESIRELMIIDAKQCVKLDKHTSIVNFAQNMVGVLRVKLKANRGVKVRFRHGEMLNKDGTLYVDNLRSAKATDYYICAGNGEIELFQPRFTVHGFQYAEIFCDDESFNLIEVQGVVIGNNLFRTGVFESNNELANRIYSNLLWGQRGNFLAVPTDCPQRDERQGWTGDAQVFCKTASYNYNTYEFFRKYLRDIRDGATKKGHICEVAPRIEKFEMCIPGWSDAIIIIPYTLYEIYGDKTVLFENIKTAENWVNYCKKHSKGFIRPDIGHGDWLNVNDDTDKSLISTAFFFRSTCLLAKAFVILGEFEKGYKYFNTAKKIKNAFEKKFITDRDLTCKSQASYVFALAFGLAENELYENFVNKLVDAIHKKDDHLSCGFMSISFLLPLLSKNGYHGLAVKLFLNETYPSWGYSVRNGATTIWERWNSYTKEHGFADIKMNSFNHYSFGSVGEWIYEYVLGIKCVEGGKGFKNWEFHPYVDRRLSEISGSYLTQYGKIEVNYKLENNNFKCSLLVPDNTTVIVNFREIDSELKTEKLSSGLHEFNLLYTKSTD